LTFFVVYWLAGLSAVALLWRRSSSDYYTAVGKQSKGSRGTHDLGHTRADIHA
jgi:hypothetical protein